MAWMDARLLDVIIGLAGFILLTILLAVLPMGISAGPAYLIAIIVFILFLAFAGYRVNEKIT
jgi:hypothetical protein